MVGIFSQLLVPKTTPEFAASVAYELLIPNPAIRTLIREKKYSQLQSAMLMARKDGCCTLKDSLTALLKDESTNQALVKARLQEIIE
jgi:Tfp pilus assembly pilus retraction ATPase PilT